MSEHWEYFPCQMGENTAFIFYDHGIRESIRSIDIRQQVRFQLTYKAPAENGLPTDVEFDAAKAIEDRITAFIESNNGIYVGRVTVSGWRFFYTYSELPEERLSSFVAELKGESGYEVQIRVSDDPDKQGYWKELFPTDDDWQMILDRRVVDVLQEKGDDPSIARPIDHWAYFASESSARGYADWLAERNFSIRKVYEAEVKGRSWCVEFFRDDKTDLYAINHVTYQLRHKAMEMDGDYDGWGTNVFKADSD